MNRLLIAKRALGVLSIGIGLAACVAPQRLARMIGLDADPGMMSAFGAREIAAGSGLLSPVEPGPWLWMRVGGDVMDLAALGGAVKRDNPRRAVAAAVAAVVGVITIIDLALAARSMINKRENEAAAA
ncbi:hypothetical protein [Phenylobacterium sp.]|jgi:hypothetical protein|uniref:hypothetical protein n=1 Tax=Phenylobacterium sp. TaxID=1871053 RepID=UPI002E375C3B|nr:hypothetical protein [Phenylobacterium sp.]HEX2561408.1 hypothetical protein [Phenylobacterium sp.]